MTQYRHAAWSVQDGSFDSAPNAIAQTADGYLWIGTGAGLVKYDGVRFIPWVPPGDTLPFSAPVYSLLSSSDGTLWIGTATRLLSLRNNTLQDHVRGRINAIIEDRKRRIWVARSRPPDAEGGLCQAVGEQPRCIGGDDHMRLPYAVTVSEDAKGNLWIGAPNQLLRWSDGSHQSYFREELERFQGLPAVESVVAAPDGSLWAAIFREGFGLLRMVDGTPQKATLRETGSAHITSLFIDRDQSLWMATTNDGIYRMAGGRVDHFRSEGGLSSNAVTRFFEDREGNLWVATSKGLDRFRDTRIVTFSTTEGLTADLVGSVLASDDGRVWIGNNGSLDVLDGHRVTSIRIPGQRVTSLMRDHTQRLWVGVDNQLTVYERGQFRPIGRPDGRPLGVAIAIAEDRDHDVWVSVVGADRKLFRIRDLVVQEEFTPEQMPFARLLVADPGGGIWLGLVNGDIARYRKGQLEVFPLRMDGLPLAGLTVDADGSVWASTGKGLVHWKDREMKTLTSRNGLPCDSVVSSIRDRQETLWLNARCGLIAIADAELTRWWQEPDTTIQVRVFDIFDGVMPGLSTFQPAVSRSADGRLWFGNDAVVQMLDPGRLRTNPIAPPVYVEGVRADRRAYSAAALVSLPARSRDIEIGYTALSFAVPQKVRFRYWLDGRDREWQDAGTRRQAFYSDLPPGEYRFRVTASNNDGVWNDQGATLAFVIAPAYYQTTWFLTLCAATLITATWVAHRVRMRIVERNKREISALNERLMNAQEQERLRIAGELHDGVMQEMLAATMMLGTAKRRITENSEAQSTIDKVQQKLIRVGTDLRQLSHELHPPVLQEAGLPKAVHAYCEEFSSTCGTAVSCDADDRVGDLSRGAALGLFRIVQEALGNASKHAHARQIAVRLTRLAEVVALEVSDDGVGFDRNRLGTPGGLGLITMRERAGQLNGTFEFESTPGRGTTIRVVIPFR